MGGKRSEVGKGDLTALYVLRPDPGHEWCDGVVGCHGETAMCASAGEDFANCFWPITVKAKSEVPMAAMIRSLRDLADAMEQGMFLDREELSDIKSSGAFSSPH